MTTQTSHPPPATDTLLRSWLRAVGLFRRTMEPYFAQFGITGAQWATVHCLHRAAQEGLTELRMADLGNRLLVRPPSVTTVVRRCEQLGLLAGRRSAADQRARCVALTPRGQKLVQEVLEHRDEQMQRVFGCLCEPDQARLSELLGQLGTHLAALMDEAGERRADVARSSG